MKMTKEAVISRLMEGESCHANDKQRALSQINKLIANKNMKDKDLAKLVKLPPRMVRKFKKLAKRVTIV